MKKIVIALSVIAFLLSSCAKKIDGSSEEAMKTSIEEIKKSLNDEKKEKFEEAKQLIVFYGLNYWKPKEEGSAEDAVTDLKSKLDGKTANDVILEGEKIQTEIERRKKEKVKEEIEKLYQIIEKPEKDKKILAKFEIKNALFYKRKREENDLFEDPVIELIVLNGTDQAISRAYFIGTLASPNRVVALIKEEFNYTIAGGIEAGEEATLSMLPSYYDWGRVDVPEDAIFTVETIKLDGADNKELYSLTKSYREEEHKERLDELLIAYPEFRK